MDTRKEWIFVLTLFAICLGMRDQDGECTDSNDSKCPHIILSQVSEVCYFHDNIQGGGKRWFARVKCNANTTDHECQTSVWTWADLPVACSTTTDETLKVTTTTTNYTSTSGQGTHQDSSSTDSATTTITAITTTTTSTTATTSLTTSSGNNTETGSVNQDLSSAASVTTTTNKTTTLTSLTASSGNYTETVLFQKHPEGNIALYVGVACVIVVLVILVVLLVVWRRKKSHNKDTHHNGIAVHNQSYRRHDWTNTNDTPIQISDLSSRGDDNEYSEIPAVTITSFNENESTYNTIDLPNGVHDNYSHVTSKTAAGNDTTYSHMLENPASKITNNTYAHIGNDSSMPQVELNPADDADDTYNKLQTLPNNGVQNKLRKPDDEMIDQDTEYNHLAADLKRPIELEGEKLGDTYSHLCQSGKRNLEHAEQGKTTQYLIQQTDVVLNNNGDSVENRSGYESVSGVSPPYLEFKVENQVDCDESNIQFMILESPTNETDDNEVQADHHYFTLEKDDS